MAGTQNTETWERITFGHDRAGGDAYPMMEIKVEGESEALIIHLFDRLSRHYTLTDFADMVDDFIENLQDAKIVVNQKLGR